MQSNAFVAACHAAGFNPRVGQVVPYISARLNLIAAGFGVAARRRSSTLRWTVWRLVASKALASSKRP
jgi:hypothetical protein